MKIMPAGSLGVFIKNGGTYLGFNILNKIIPFLLLPLMTHYIDPDGYGKISMFSIVLSLSMMLVGFCSNTVVTQKYHKISAEERQDLIGASYYVMGVTYIAAAVLVWFFGQLLAEALKLDWWWIELAVFSGLMGMILTMRTTVFQLTKDAWKYGLFQGSSALVNVLLSLFLVVVMRYAWQGRVISIAVSSVLIAAASVYYSVRKREIDASHLPSKISVNTILKLGGALLPAGISGWVFAMSDRLFLNRMISLEAVGIYSVGLMVAQISEFTFNSVGQSYMPFFYERIHSQVRSTKVKLVRTTYLIAAGYGVFALLMVFFCPLILRLMTNERYHAAASIVGIMSCSYALTFTGYLFYNYVISTERNIVTAYISYLTLGANLVANYFLIRAYGITGAAIANVVSSTVFMVANIAVTARHCKMPWFDKEVFFGATKSIEAH